jgi:peptidoglycan hydrolase CwlO-like protein
MRVAVEPQAAIMQILAESMSAREQKLTETNEALKKLQAELDALHSAQSTDQTKLKETQSKLEALEAAAEEAESAAEATKEKFEFFKSAYGA